MWTPLDPDNFSRFEPTDILAFLDWFEREYANAMALGFADAFVEGLMVPYLEAIASGVTVPWWIDTMLRYRMAAQWSYQVGEPLSRGLQRNLAAIIPDDRLLEYADRFKITPTDIANIPPAIRNAFLEGASFSLQWIQRLSDDARSLMSDLMAIETLKNRNPTAAVPMLERILRRDLVAQGLGIAPADVTPEQVEVWLNQAEFKTLAQVAYRANMISRTETMRMTNLGILTALEQDGFDLAYVMPHKGSCHHCRRLIDGRVFRIAVLKENLFKNFGQKPQNWVASLPQHPHCRHSVMSPPIAFRDVLKRFGIIPDEGVVLQWYGLPGGEAAMQALDLLPVAGWLLP